MPKCDACRAEGAKQRCTKCQGCWSCDKACAKRFWRTHKKFCTDDPLLKPHVPIELAFERALAQEPKTEAPPENATCYICLETEGPNGGKVTRGCACRGPSAGFAHVECLAEMASRNPWIDLGEEKQLSRWNTCPTCRSGYVGAMEMEMHRCLWRQERDKPLSNAKLDALACMSAELRRSDEFDAADWLDEELTRVSETADPNTQVRLCLAKARGHVVARRDREALEILARLRPIVERHTDNALRLAYAEMTSRVLVYLDRFQEALPFAVEAVARATQAAGPESEQALLCRQVHARTLVMLGQVGEGKVSLARVLASQTRILGADHPDTLWTKNVLDRLSA